MAITNQSYFPTTAATSWIPYENFQLVWEGTIDVTSPGEKVINLDTPFLYSGWNLVIMGFLPLFEVTVGSTFYKWQATNDATNAYSIRMGNNTSNYTPETSIGIESGNAVISRRPNITLTIFENNLGILNGSVANNLEGVDIYIFNNSATCSGTTDNEGNFTIRDIPPDNYILVAFSQGYEVYYQDIEIFPFLNSTTIELETEIAPFSLSRVEFEGDSIALFGNYSGNLTVLTGFKLYRNNTDQTGETILGSYNETTEEYAFSITETVLGMYNYTVSAAYLFNAESTKSNPISVITGNNTIHQLKTINVGSDCYNVKLKGIALIDNDDNHTILQENGHGIFISLENEHITERGKTYSVIGEIRQETGIFNLINAYTITDEMELNYNETNYFLHPLIIDSLNTDHYAHAFVNSLIALEKVVIADDTNHPQVLIKHHNSTNDETFPLYLQGITEPMESPFNVKGILRYNTSTGSFYLTTRDDDDIYYTETTILAGSVTDDDNILEDVCISLSNSENVYETISDWEGYYFTDIEIGDYTLTATKAEYDTFRTSITIYSGENDFDITMTKTQTSNTDSVGNGFIRSALINNYPNPFNPSTTIHFTVGNGFIRSAVKIDIYNIKGQKIRSLLNENLKSGNHSIVWNGKDDLGNECSSGIYFYLMKTNDFTSAKRMLLLK
jgi:hypothetical protein